MALQETMKALSDPVRRQILVLLREGELPAGEIAQQLGMSPPAISHHLQKLKTAGLVFERKEKNFIFYELNTSFFEELLLWIKQFQSTQEERHETAEQTLLDSHLSSPDR